MIPLLFANSFVDSFTQKQRCNLKSFFDDPKFWEYCRTQNWEAKEGDPEGQHISGTASKGKFKCKRCGQISASKYKSSTTVTAATRSLTPNSKLRDHRRRQCPTPGSGLENKWNASPCHVKSLFDSVAYSKQKRKYDTVYELLPPNQYLKVKIHASQFQPHSIKSSLRDGCCASCWQCGGRIPLGNLAQFY